MGRPHKVVEDLVHKMHKEDTPKLLKEFDKFMEKMQDKYLGVLLPHYRIAEHCLKRENNRYGRRDTLSIKSVPKKVK